MEKSLPGFYFTLFINLCPGISKSNVECHTWSEMSGWCNSNLSLGRLHSFVWNGWNHNIFDNSKACNSMFTFHLQDHKNLIYSPWVSPIKQGNESGGILSALIDTVGVPMSTLKISQSVSQSVKVMFVKIYCCSTCHHLAII